MAAHTGISVLSLRSNAHVAPLHIRKDLHDIAAAGQTILEPGSMSLEEGHACRNVTHSEMTPPSTPHGPADALSSQAELPPPAFCNFLRAIYSYHPDYAVSSTAVTLPLNVGDLILVHSIHAKGWADGTLLTTGARGWLPTNYCEAYDQDSMSNLLRALLNFWDLLRGDGNTSLDSFCSQDYVKGIVAGVRYLLDDARCLTREAPLVKSHDGLRKNRKGLLSDLSSLVKTARHLQELTEDHPSAECIDEVISHITLKAFKIVTRAVRFLDVWTSVNDVNRCSANLIHVCRDGVNFHHDHTHVPPTPPADSLTFGQAISRDVHDAPAGPMPTGAHQPNQAAPIIGVDAVHHHASQSPAHHPCQQTEQASLTNATVSSSLVDRLTAASTTTTTTTTTTPPLPPTTVAASTTSTIQHPHPHPSHHRSSSVVVKRSSAAHRVSLPGEAPTSQTLDFASHRLGLVHDAFLSRQGSFIGRLHLEVPSPPAVLAAVQQTVIACKDLLAVVEAVWERDLQRSDSLGYAKEVMYSRITDFVHLARDIFRSGPYDDDRDFLTTQESRELVCAATSCVRAAGECVAQSKFVFERIGDFEFEPVGLGILSPTTSHWHAPSPEPAAGEAQGEDRASAGVTVISAGPESYGSFPAPPAHIPQEPSPRALSSASTSREMTPHSMTGRLHETQQQPSFLPNIPQCTSPLLSHDDYTQVDIDIVSNSPPTGSAISHTATADLSDHYAEESNAQPHGARDREASIMSQTSTRATTPDPTLPYSLISSSGVSTSSAGGSQTTLGGDCEEAEARVLERTYAHELVYNKDGLITGGTLPALVERLTTHDATPDSTFVSTFYLTFRLFTTSTDFARTLVARFDDVESSGCSAGPVRLRVYNVFKGWLESHWQHDCDCDALDLILDFATEKLARVLPTAGKRLAELVDRVAQGDGSLVPRLVSSMGKTSTSVAQYVAPDTPLPAPVISKSQLAALRNWKQGGAELSILDFDPLELARQFTIKESRIFCSILPEELLGMEWTKKIGSKAINVRAMSTLSTDLATLVTDTILHLEDPRKRATMIKQWVKIAKKSLELNNYDSLMAIVCSLDSSTILRMKKTWESVSQKTRLTLEELRSVIDVSKNYAVLRQRLQHHVPPCLPFVGTYLTDLTFVDVGNQTTRQLRCEGASEERSVVNFDKHMRTAKIIGELQRFQIPYRLTAVAELQEWMDAQIHRVRVSEDASIQNYYRRSLLLEPRELAPQRPSPTDSTHSSYTSQSARDRFDFRTWTHAAREKSAVST
ncbi:MAG: hypothetical protein M1817_003969 [Caeruleum heppii]|nr:MAG: hypothetical protein M1817_003969 [Caeruleum heppii]